MKAINIIELNKLRWKIFWTLKFQEISWGLLAVLALAGSYWFNRVILHLDFDQSIAAGVMELVCLAFLGLFVWVWLESNWLKAGRLAHERLELDMKGGNRR